MPRVWDTYLTEQDKAWLAKRPDARLGFGERPGLLLIDLYRWVFGDRPQPLLEAIAEWPSSCGLAAWNALPHIRRLLEAARARGVPVFYSTDIENDEYGFVGWAKRSKGRRGDPPSAAEQARLAGRYAIVPEIAPQPGDVVVQKSAPSAFSGTPLLGQLNARGVDTLVVAGESTSGCVRASVVDAATHRFNTIVAEECVFDRHEATHALNLFDMHQKYADVVGLDEILAYLERR